MNVLTEIEVTESYLALDKDIRGCQNEEPFDNCTTRQFIDTFLDKCGCLPLNIRLNEVRIVKNTYSKFKPLIKIIQEPLCTFHELECVNKMKVDTSSCLKPCSGLIVTSLIKSDSEKKLENLLPNYAAYNKYKKITQYPSGSDGKIM